MAIAPETAKGRVFLGVRSRQGVVPESMLGAMVSDRA